MESVKLRLGLQTIMLISARGNTYLQASGLNKALLESDPKRCASVVGRAINLIYVLTALVYPFMPAVSDGILKQLNAPPRVVPSVLSLDILPGHVLGTPEHLFKKIEDSMAETFRVKFAGLDGAAPAALPSEAVPAAAKIGAPEVAVSKRKLAAAKKAADKAAVKDAGPKSPEVLALEEKISKQGGIVRELKGTLPKTEDIEAQITAAVDTLKKLKEELAAL